MSKIKIDPRKPFEDLYAKAKPCPFCGEKLQIKEDHHGFWLAHWDEPGPCEVSVTQLFNEKDVEHWNKRAIDPNIKNICLSLAYKASNYYDDLFLRTGNTAADNMGKLSKVFEEAWREKFGG